MAINIRFQAWAFKLALVGIIMIIFSFLNWFTSKPTEGLSGTVATLGYLLIGLTLTVTGFYAAFSKNEKE